MSDSNCFEGNGSKITVEYFFDCMRKWSEEQDLKREGMEKRITGHTSEVVDQIGKRIDDSNKAIVITAENLKDHKDNDKNWRIGLGATVFIICVFYPAAYTYISSLVRSFI